MRFLHILALSGMYTSTTIQTQESGFLEFCGSMADADKRMEHLRRCQTHALARVDTVLEKLERIDSQSLSGYGELVFRSAHAHAVWLKSAIVQIRDPTVVEYNILGNGANEHPTLPPGNDADAVTETLVGCFTEISYIQYQIASEVRGIVADRRFVQDRCRELNDYWFPMMVTSNDAGRRELVQLMQNACNVNFENVNLTPAMERELLILRCKEFCHSMIAEEGRMALIRANEVQLRTVWAPADVDSVEFLIEQLIDNREGYEDLVSYEIVYEEAVGLRAALQQLIDPAGSGGREFFRDGNTAPPMAREFWDIWNALWHIKESNAVLFRQLNHYRNLVLERCEILRNHWIPAMRDSNNPVLVDLLHVIDNACLNNFENTNLANVIDNALASLNNFENTNLADVIDNAPASA